MRLVMLGGPGSGKGTQSKELSQELGNIVISTGDVLREAIATQTPLGIQAKEYVEKGELVPDIMMIEFIKERLLRSDVENGWILEGYPRSAFQGEELDFLLEELNQDLNWAIYLKVSEETMKERSFKRGMDDDRPEIVARRIKNFNEVTVSILEYYDYKKKLLTIDAEKTPKEVKEDILKNFNK